MDGAVAVSGRDVRRVRGDASPWQSIAARLARTIVVVTAASGQDHHGMTADSFTLVSHDPALVMVAVAVGSRTHRLLASVPGFGVSVLAAEQAAVATHFASRRRSPGIRQFDLVNWETAPHSGAPVLTEALAWLDCERRDLVPAGDHVLVVGQVVAAGTRNRPGGPLVRCERRYLSLGPWPDDAL
jgi:flavin reductase (DIM6/NTAB) family NADH-FMN oxidoreductase RutF